jgi:hypothetical protein
MSWTLVNNNPVYFLLEFNFCIDILYTKIFEHFYFETVFISEYFYRKLTT